MRKLGWLSIAFVIAGPLVAVALSGEPDGVLEGISRSLWVLAFSASIISISLLVVNLGLDRVAPVSLSLKHLSWAYLSIGPSLSPLSIAATLGIPTPAWVEDVAPVILPMSALAFFKSLGPLEEKAPGTSKEFEQAEAEIWAMVNGVDPSGSAQNLE